MNTNTLTEKKIRHQEEIRRLIYSNQFKSFNTQFLSISEKFALFLLSVKTPADLCQFFNAPHFEIENCINQPIYTTYYIHKNKGGLREISAPSPFLKKLQQKLNKHLQGVYLQLKPECSKGFVLHLSGRELRANIVENALPHVGKKYVLNMDLEDFFTSISSQRVYTLFRSAPFHFNQHLAKALTYLTTIKGSLPQGAPTSPVLSNLVCLALDEKLTSLSKRFGLQYTRYADDLTFSSNSPIQAETIEEIRSIIHEEEFRVNEKKYRLQAANRKQVVTGLVVNNKVNVDRKLLRQLRAIFHDIQLNGVHIAIIKHYDLNYFPTKQDEDNFLMKLRGLNQFVSQIRGKDDPKVKEFQFHLSAAYGLIEDFRVRL